MCVTHSVVRKRGTEVIDAYTNVYNVSKKMLTIAMQVSISKGC